MSQLKDDLIEMAHLIEIGWVQRRMAVNNRGVSVEPWSSDACRWCLMGAAERTVDEKSWSGRYGDIDAALSRAAIAAWDFARAKPSESVQEPFIRWNDKRGRTQEQVVALVKQAAESAP